MTPNPTPAAAPAGITAAQTEHEFLATIAPPEEATKDNRNFPRFNYQACMDAVVHPPAAVIAPEPVSCQVLSRDISRAGMNILHKQPLFPGQLLDVVLKDGHQRRLEVIWCRRLGPGCFNAGCRFVRAEPPPSKKQTG